MQKRIGWTALMLTLALAIGLTLTPALAEKSNFFVVNGDDEEGGNYEVVAPSIFYFDDDSAYLGVQIEEDVDHEEGGAVITQIVDGSPAEAAGLEVGDVVIRIDRDTIRGPASLTKKIREREPGESVRITVRRNGRQRDFDVELAERSFSRGFNFSFDADSLEGLAELKDLEIPHIDMEELRNSLANVNTDFNFNFEGLSETLAETRTLFEDCEEEDGECNFSYGYRFAFGGPTLGVHLTEVTPELREHLGARDTVGVLVNKIVEDSAAEDAGVRVGDLIVDVDGDEISSTNDLRHALSERAGETFSIEVVRDGRPMTLSVTLEEEERGERRFGPRAAISPHPVTTTHVVLAPTPSAVPAPPLPRRLAVTAPSPPSMPQVVSPRLAAPSVPTVPRHLPQPPVPAAPVATTIGPDVI